MAITKESILSVLSQIQEPELKKDIVSQNLVESIDFSENYINTTILITNPALHARKRMQELVDFQLKKSFGTEIKLTTIVKPLSNDSIQNIRKILPKVKHIIAIASGKGGVGKSTITANLAGGLVKLGFKVGIVDADIYGPSIPTMFDVVGERPTMLEVQGTSKINPVISYGIKILSIGFFTEHNNAVVWRGPMAAKAMTQLFTDAHWGN